MEEMELEEREIYGVFFYDREQRELFSCSCLDEEYTKKISIPNIFKACDIEDVEGIELIFSLKIDVYMVDVAFGNDVYCVTIFDTRTSRNGSVNPICALFYLQVLQKEFSGEYNFGQLKFLPVLYTELSAMFSCFTSPDFAEMFIIISPCQQIFCKFGSIKLSPEATNITWSIALELALAIENSPYIIPQQSDFIFGFDFLNFAKIIAFFSHQAVDNYEPQQIIQEFTKNIAEMMEAMKELFLM